MEVGISSLKIRDLFYLPKLYSRNFELIFIFLPSIIIPSIFLMLKYLANFEFKITLYSWLISTIIFDGGHIYFTLLKTYGNPIERKKLGATLLLVPLVALIFSFFLYRQSVLAFVNFTAYFAIFHFIKQQYGFLKLYSRTEFQLVRIWQWIDYLLVYLLMIYPIIYWHANYPKSFYWHAPETMFKIPEHFEITTKYILFLSILAFIVKELYLISKGYKISIPKYLILFGTFLSWFTSIVFVDNLLFFTVIIELTHAIPYIALVWIYGKKFSMVNPTVKFFNTLTYKDFHSNKSLIYYILLMLLFGFLGFVLYLPFGFEIDLMNNQFFSYFQVSDFKLLQLITPLFLVPQFTHYILDGLIWKSKNGNGELDYS